MKKLIVALLMAGMCGVASAKGIEAEHAWARATVAGMSMGGVFVDIQNDTTQDDALVGGITPVANKVEVHTHVNENGVMKMRPVEGGVPLPRHKQVKLQPNGYHLMLMGLKAPLKAGDTFPLTLTFKHATPQTVVVRIESPQQREAHQHHEHMH